MAEVKSRWSSPISADTHLPACMSLVAGLVDVAGWLTLGGLFTAHITGNLVVIAASLVRGGPLHAAPTLAVPMFAIAVVVADLSTRRLGADHRARSTALLLLQTALLLGAFVLSVLREHGDSLSGHVVLVQAMFAVSAMATQNTLLHLTQKKVSSTAVMTGNLVAASIAAVDLLRPSSKHMGEENWRATWPLLLCFFLGCGLGALLVKIVGSWVWLVPAAVSLSYVLWFWSRTSATEAVADGITV